MIVAPGRVSSRPSIFCPKREVESALCRARCGPLFDLAISGAIEISQCVRCRRSCVCPPAAAWLWLPGAAQAAGARDRALTAAARELHSAGATRLCCPPICSALSTSERKGVSVRRSTTRACAEMTTQGAKEPGTLFPLGVCPAPCSLRQGAGRRTAQIKGPAAVVVALRHELHCMLCMLCMLCALRPRSRLGTAPRPTTKLTVRARA